MAIEPTVRLETSSGATRFTTANTSSAATANENLQHYPLAAAHFVDQVPLSSTVNEKALFKKRLVANYPAKYILFLALALLLLNFFILYCEISLNQLRYYQYNVYFVSKYAVITSLTNNLYAIMALISTKFRNYFFIQLVSLLHLVGFFATGFFSVFLNVMSFMLIVMENTCQGHCILIETLTLVAAFISAVFSMALFIKLQFNFLPNLNKNIFTSTSTS